MAERKKIGLLIPGMSRGGAERVAAILSKKLRDDFDVILIVYHCEKPAYSVAVDIIDMNLPAKPGLKNSLLNFVRRCSKLSQISTENKLDIIISFLNSANMVNAFSKKNDIKKIISIRSYHYGERNSSGMKEKVFDMFYRLNESLMIERVDKVVSVSKMIQGKLEQLYPNQKEKLCTIYNPYELDIISDCSNEEVENWNDYFNMEDFIFVTVGRLESAKGLWHLIKVFSYVAKDNPNVKLLIVGDGSDRERLCNAICEMGIEKQVVMVGDQSNPFKFVKRSDVYLLTSIREGFPNALVEAMACGIPVIANDCYSGPREILCEEPDFSHEVVGMEKMDYGILTPRLRTYENWNCKNVELEPEEYIFATAMKKITTDREMLLYYSRMSQMRASDFSIKECIEEYKKII